MHNDATDSWVDKKSRAWILHFNNSDLIRIVK